MLGESPHVAGGVDFGNARTEELLEGVLWVDVINGVAEAHDRAKEPIVALVGAETTNSITSRKEKLNSGKFNGAGCWANYIYLISP